MYYVFFNKNAGDTFTYYILGAVHMRQVARLDGLAHVSEMIFIPHSYGIFYLTLMKKFDMSMEKDCCDHVVFERELFYFQ